MSQQPDLNALMEKVINAIRLCYDPEIPVNIYDLGLVYEININELGEADIQMTLTSPACPVAGSLPGEVEEKVETVDGITKAKVEVVWDPPWDPSLMSEEAKLELGIM
ncbi:SUF system Fe-S cluster assembly protein [candidate division KSB1 bacterium RBG_16_48_16]|nr:MAG: SUF system Fe-S cluster assembly protein [candidate division KSB1 bacterium RBG_16_48_16]